MLRTLEREHRNIESIFQQVANRYAQLLEQMDDPYLRERALDIHDVTRRVVMNLVGKPAVTLADIHHPHILLAQNLTPSDTALLNREFVLGFATDAGSRTSHTAIMARSLNIPAIVGLARHQHASGIGHGRSCSMVTTACSCSDPTEQTLREYEELSRRKQRVEAGLVNLRETASTTADGHHLVLSANIELARGHSDGQDQRCGGCGLIPHGVFLPQQEASLPDEEEQYENYRRVASEILPHPIIIRTLDLGGDKFIGTLAANRGAETEPLSWDVARSAFALEHPDDFQGATSRHPARQRVGQREDDVPAHQRSGGSPARSQRAAGGVQKGIARGGQAISTTRWRSAS